jgi:hypothetical protein
MTLKEVRSIGKVEAFDLEERARAGDPEAAVRFAWYAAWKSIEQNPVLTRIQRARAYNLLTQRVKLTAVPNG